MQPEQFMHHVQSLEQERRRLREYGREAAEDDLERG
jgi:hypothetical protein